ncbi:hypothetical protein HK100_002141 [Physocladia obscura]|uniref:TauD/TfdA-like domain-containing protein n=1 Tax=Physocladia obscura TaxID=109957 RepID=A0AAD5SVN7_9FUNG|nr:hypothetical protein HK100_002141 [Physocladia obscura]
MTGFPIAPLVEGKTGFGLYVFANPALASEADLEEFKRLLFIHSVLVFRHETLTGGSFTPKQQLDLTAAFGSAPTGIYGHGAGKKQEKSILHPDLVTLPTVPQVQLIGNGLVTEPHHGVPPGTRLNHPHHRTFHRTRVSDEDDVKGVTRFYRWHIDAALYALYPPIVTTLHAIKLPPPSTQLLRYDDGSNDELNVSIGTTAFISGATAFDILTPAQKSLVVRGYIKYAPHPYVWMGPAKSRPTGLGMESEGLELSLGENEDGTGGGGGPGEVPEWSEDKVMVFPMVWKNPVTRKLHLQIHPSAIHSIIIDPLPQSPTPFPIDTLYPTGAKITDLKEARDLVYSLQRAGIAPDLVYAHDWQEGDVCLFHNRGVLHSVVGAFPKETVRMFHQCNLAGSEAPAGPEDADLELFCHY